MRWQVLLTRWDLFHAHCFCTPEEKGLGLLFHAKEYPSQDEKAFPFNLGYCQRNSPLTFDSRAMDMRNLVYFQVPLFAMHWKLHTGALCEGLLQLCCSIFGRHSEVN